MTALVDRIKVRLPAAVRRPLAAAASYARGRRVLDRYTAHYRQARAAYGADAALALPERFGVHVLGAGERLIALPDDYPALLRRVRDDARARFEIADGLSFFPKLADRPRPERTAEIDEVNDGDVIIMRVIEPWAVDGVVALSAAIVSELERKVFGSHAIVDRAFVYRSPISRRRPRASWLWHYDNYPREILKVMIYLTDVTADSAPFEYLRHADTHEALPGTPLSPGFGDSRITAEQMTRLQARGYEPFAVTGAAGTMLIFDNNVVHRATLATRAHRDVLVLQVRPSRLPDRGVVDPRWTGSFQQSGFNLDPDDHQVC